MGSLDHVKATETARTELPDLKSVRDVLVFTYCESRGIPSNPVGSRSISNCL